MNKSDSERLSTVLHSMGFGWTDKEEDADLLGILACSVRQKAIDKVYTRIGKWNKMKNRKSLLTFVSGCMLPSDKEKFLKLFDLVFTMNELPELPDMMKQYGIVTPFSVSPEAEETITELTGASSSFPGEYPSLLKLLQEKDSIKIGVARSDIGAETESASGKNTGTKTRDNTLTDNREDSGTNIKEDNRSIMDGFWHIKPVYSSPFEAFVPIQNGCDKFCTYCAVPYTRGREVSRPHEEILQEISSLIEQGYKSITLLGQNVNSYGLDKINNGGISFPNLLRLIGELGIISGKEFLVYFTSPHPRDMTNEVIDVISQYKCLGKQIHLPLQSGDNKVLERMNRKHDMQKYREIVEYIRYKIPEATLFTDIIVGFTGESEEEFRNTRRAFEEFDYNMAYIAIYSPRPGAVSSKWQDDVPHNVKKERLHILTGDLEKSSFSYTKSMIGKTFRVLVTGMDRKKKYLAGYTEGKINIRFRPIDRSLIGKFVNLKISSATEFSVEGELLEQTTHKGA